MSWQPKKLSEFLTEREGRIKHEQANGLGLQRIKKIDFSGAIHLDAETDTKTNMIRVKDGDLVISGINAAKGAISVYEGDEDVLATIHYSSYEFDPDQISVEFLKWFFRSSEFSDLLKEQIPGGIKTELKPKHILPLRVSLPKLTEQISIAKRLNDLRLEQLKLEQEIAHQQSLLGKLKQAILQEAIQGKLTEAWRAANPNIEPASQLLQRIQAEKARLIAEKKLRKEKPLPKITPEEIPFDTPAGWEWCRIGAIGSVKVGATPKREDATLWGGAVSWVSSGEVANNEIWKTRETISDKATDSTSAKVNPAGSVLVAMIGQGKTRGQTAILKINAATNQNVAAIRLQGSVLSEFVWLFFLGRYEETRSGASGGNQPALNGIKIRNSMIPLPPLAEQAAIFERVEALMATCRELETEIEHSRTAAAHLLQAVLKEAFAPASMTLPEPSKSREKQRTDNNSQKPAGTQTAPMNPINSSLKSFILRSFKMASGYRSLSNPDCEFHEDIDIPSEAAPICLVGLNGSGKSNLIEAVADVFCFLELINLPWASLSSASSKYRKNDHKFELSYTITDAGGNRLILVRKTKKTGADFYEIDEDEKETPITDPRERLKVLPRRIIGYSSGLNETVSHTFLRTRTLYSQEVRDAAPADDDESLEVFDTRTLYMDYENNAEILLCNYIFRKSKELEFIRRFTRVAGVSTFELRFNRKITGKQGKSSIARITDELASYLEKFARCAGKEYDEEKLDHSFSYELDSKTKKLFIEEFETAENLFLAMYKWSLLNALVLSDDQRKAFLKDDITKGTLERPPVVPPKSRLFDVADMKVTLSEPDIVIDYSGLSDGEHQFVQVFGTVLLFNEPGTLFLFDEPESHFNPEWRTQFNSILNSTPNAASHEYIISTHSPYIVSGSRGENVYKFERNGPTVTCEPVDFETYGASFDDLLKKLFSIKSLIDTGAKDELGEILKRNDLEEMESAVGEFAESREKRRLYEAILKKQQTSK